MPSPQRILDAGTGTGCVLISLLQEFPEATGVGIDLSSDALEVAQENGKTHGVLSRSTWCQSNWLEGVAGPFDLIVSNPPYIPSHTIADLDREVRDFDPRLALDGGDDGLDPYRVLIPQAASVLSPRGVLVLECGQGQGLPLQLLLQASFPYVRVSADLAGILRYGQGSFEPLEPL
jgi:release factor glutamine methyltransferase